MWGSMWMTRCTRSLRAFRTTAMGRLLGSCWGQFARTIHRNIVSCCTMFKANILTAHLFPCFIDSWLSADWLDWHLAAHWPTEPNGHNQTGDKIHKTYQNMLVRFKGFSCMIYIFELSNPPDIEPIRKHQPASHLGRIIGLMPADRSDGQAWPSCRSFASSWWRTWVSSPPSLPRSFVTSTFSPAPQPGCRWLLSWLKEDVYSHRIHGAGNVWYIC